MSDFQIYDVVRRKVVYRKVLCRFRVNQYVKERFFVHE